MALMKALLFGCLLSLVCGAAVSLLLLLALNSLTKLTRRLNSDGPPSAVDLPLVPHANKAPRGPQPVEPTAVSALIPAVEGELL